MLRNRTTGGTLSQQFLKYFRSGHWIMFWVKEYEEKYFFHESAAQYTSDLMSKLLP